jgi:Asp-tRNA(Asn)/Glu-tRNA(Gln) amidotransferase A subunit family amidase
MTPMRDVPADLWRMSATELAEAIRSKQVSSREVIEAHLRRIEAVDPEVNAVPVVLGEQALEAAGAADRAVALGGDLPRLHGVPFVVKSNIDVAGTPTTQGVRAFADAYPQMDAPVVRPDRRAAGECQRAPGPPVADLQAVFEVIAGYTWRDPWSVPAPLRGPGPRTPIRVALVVDPAGQGTAKPVQQAVRAAARALEDAGYAVEELEPPSIGLAARTCLDMLNTPDIRAMWEMTAGLLPPGTQQFLEQFYAEAGDPDPVATMQAFVTRHALLTAWGQFQQTYPMIVAPICTELPFKAGTDLSENRVAAEIGSLRMTTAVNALGLPAVAVPVGVADGLPQAVQVIGPRYSEDLCLDAGQAIEASLGVITPIDPR